MIDRLLAALARERAEVAAVGIVKPLTDAERRVLDQVLRGASTIETARELGISPRTVEKHRARIRQKTGARSLTQAAAVLASGAKWSKRR